MIKTNLYEPSETKRIKEQKGIFSIIEYERDMSVAPDLAQMAYYASKMDVRKRQLIAEISKNAGVITQKGMMQLMLGDLQAETGVESAGDLIKKYVGGRVSGESAIKPHYTGYGTLLLEPTFMHIILEDLDDWGGQIVVEDGMFLACEDSVDISVSGRSNVSSAVLGGEGLFNATFAGHGVVALESPVPRDELIVIDIEKDVVKIDGNMAIAWSKDLDFTVERTTPTLIGSVAAKEGLVNVYRGTGRILVAPILENKNIAYPPKTKN